MKLSKYSWLSLIVLLSLMVGASLFRVYVHHEAVILGYALQKEERGLKKSQERLRQLELEYLAQTAPARLKILAQKLGMDPAREARDAP